jgi:hypothetical protein
MIEQVAAKPSRINALKTGVVNAGRRVLDIRPSFSKPDIHVTKAGVVKGAAVGGLAAGELFGLAGCAPGTQTPDATASYTPTAPITTPGPSVMPSETAYQSQVVETPAPTTTPAEKTPAPTQKPIEAITNPAPSEKPQTPITAQQMLDAVKAFTTANAGGDIPANGITIINNNAKSCTDASMRDIDRLNLCEATAGVALQEAYMNNDPLAWQAAFNVYWYTIGPNGMGPSVKAQFDAQLAKLQLSL